MSEPSRSITYGGVLPTEQYARPMAPSTLPRIEWPSQWGSRQWRCWHCRTLLYPTGTPTPTEPIVQVGCWSCGRTLCELVPDGYRAMTAVEFAALPVTPRRRSGGPKPRAEGSPPLCCDCSIMPATRRWRLCDECMEARQQAARNRRQHELRARERVSMTQAQRDARNARRRARRREREGVTTWE